MDVLGYLLIQNNIYPATGLSLAFTGLDLAARRREDIHFDILPDHDASGGSIYLGAWRINGHGLAGGSLEGHQLRVGPTDAAHPELAAMAESENRFADRLEDTADPLGEWFGNWLPEQDPSYVVRQSLEESLSFSPLRIASSTRLT